MFETGYFILGILNNLFLISVFLTARFFNVSKLKNLGIAYLCLMAPAALGIVYAIYQYKPWEYSVFLGIFIAFLMLEGLYEYILKLPFRNNWRLLVPYLILYWAMNYGFIVMAWKYSKMQGGVLLGLFIVQLTANIISHTKRPDEKSG